MILGFEHAVQLSVFLKAIGAGFFIGIMFFLVMLINCFFGKHTYSVFIRDVIFFLSATVFTVLFALKYNAGIIRFYILCGELMGFLLFYIFPASVISARVRRFAERAGANVKKRVSDCKKERKEKKEKRALTSKRNADKTDKRKNKIFMFCKKISIKIKKMPKIHKKI